MMDLRLSSFEWFLVISVLGIIIYRYITKSYNCFSKRSVPHLKPLPFIGNMGPAIFKKQTLDDFILSIYKKLDGHPYGGIFSFMQPAVMLRDPQLIKNITVKDFEYFTDRRSFFSEKIEPLWGRALFNLTGHRWKYMHSLLTPAFTPNKMKSMSELVSTRCKNMINFLEQLPRSYNKNKDGELLILEIKDFYTRYINDVIATSVFGVSVDSLKQPRNKFYTMGQIVNNFGSLHAFKLMGFFFFPKLMQLFGTSLIPTKVTEFFKSLLYETILIREQEGIKRPDIIQLLMDAKKNSQSSESKDTDEDNYKLDNDDIVAQALLFFIVGFDTVSTLISITSHQLAIHPEIQDRLQKEIDETLKDGDGEITYEIVNNMKYLDMVISETLRKFPPVATMDRSCVRHYTLHADPPLDIGPGNTIIIPTYALHHDPKYFPDPESFDPERFSDSNRHNITPFTYLPFGAGPRGCLGSQVAMMEVKIALVHLLTKYNVLSISRTPSSPKIIRKGYNMTIEGGLWLGLQHRTS